MHPEFKNVILNILESKINLLLNLLQIVIEGTWIWTEDPYKHTTGGPRYSELQGVPPKKYNNL